MRLALALAAVLAVPAAAAPAAGLQQLQCFVATGCARATAVAAPAGVVVSGDGRTVYVRSGVGALGTLGVFGRGTTGRLRQLQCVARRTRACADGRGLETPAALAVSPDGRSVYVAARNGRSLGVYRRLASGKLVAAGSVGGLSHPQAVAVSPDGRTVYVGGDRTYILARRATGAVRLVSTAPAAAAAIALTPNGRFVYTAAGGGAHGFLRAWRRNATTGALTPIGATLCGPADGPGCTTAPGLLQPAALAFTPGSSRLWIVSTVSAAVTQYRVDPATGAIGAAVARRGRLPLAFDVALAGGQAYVAFRDGVAVLDTALRPRGVTRLARATGVAAVGRSVYAASSRRITVFAR
jgi:DNA-binding beta-propeller fold protein YncE